MLGGAPAAHGAKIDRPRLVRVCRTGEHAVRVHALPECEPLRERAPLWIGHERPLEALVEELEDDAVNPRQVDQFLGHPVGRSEEAKFGRDHFAVVGLAPEMVEVDS